MKVGIMQPYLLPYLGYFQIMNACDKFVVYDNIKFTKKGWIHRNRMLLNNTDLMFSLPLKKDSDFLDIDQRFIADTFKSDKNKILGQIRSSYSKAPHFATAYPVIEGIFNYPDNNLFNFILNSLVAIKAYLSIDTALIVSSTIDIDHSLKGKYRVMEICKNLKAKDYINPIGGMELYDKEEFQQNGLNLYFHKMHPITYPQNSTTFLPSLSILDVMMYNSKDNVTEYLHQFDLL